MSHDATSTPHRSLWRLRRDESGQSLVELAVVLPVFLLILLGILDFGKALNYWITETQVSAEGARRGAVNVSGAGLQTYVKNQIKIRQLRDNASICVSFPDSNLKTVGHPIKVTVSYRFNWLPFLDRFGGVGTITLKDSSTMRLEAISTATTANNINAPC